MAVTQIKESSAKALMTGFTGTSMLIGGVEIGIRTGEGVDNTGNIDYVPDESGRDSYAIVSNLGERLSIEAVIYESVTAPRKGQLVTIGDTSYIVESSNLRRAVGVARLSMTVYHPDGVTWTSPGA